MERQRIALLGSTGSIGEQTLAIVRNRAEEFEITTLTANNSWQKLVAQAIEFEPDSVVIANREWYSDVVAALGSRPIKVYAGREAIEQVVSSAEVDVVVNALVGYAGMMPTVRAIEAGKKLALANKESLVVGGEIIMKMAMAARVPIIPIDSEHSAVFQCLAGERSPIEKIILTASGGPFLKRELSTMSTVTVEEALRHPNWTMGSKITIDSATMLNKGFEVIEAYWLFGVEPSRIEVVVHPQSIIHSMVEFADGAIKAQLGTPDMCLPIQYALTYPDRMALPSGSERFSFTDHGQLTFMPADAERFPCLAIAYDVLQRGGNSGCVLNAANEVAVAAFLDRKIAFTDIPQIIRSTLDHATFTKDITLNNLSLSNEEARQIALKLV